jgi:hypothetical protein
MASATQHLARTETPANEPPARLRRWTSPDARLHSAPEPTRASVTLYADVVTAPNADALAVLERASARAIAAGFRVRTGDPERLHAAIDADADAIATVTRAIAIARTIAEQGLALGVRTFVHLGHASRTEPGSRLPEELEASLASQPEPGLWLGAAARRLSKRR